LKSGLEPSIVSSCGQLGLKATAQIHPDSVYASTLDGDLFDSHKVGYFPFFLSILISISSISSDGNRLPLTAW